MNATILRCMPNCGVVTRFLVACVAGPGGRAMPSSTFVTDFWISNAAGES